MSSFGLLRLCPASRKLYFGYKSVLNQYRNIQCKFTLRKSNLSSEVLKTQNLNTKTTAEKDKLLFYNENPKFFLFLNGFSLIQFLFWIQMSEFMYSKMKDIKKKPNVPDRFIDNFAWWQRLDFEDKTTRTLASALFFFIGLGTLALSWMYTQRSVRMLVLRKDGKTVTFVTYGPFPKNRTVDVPLDEMSTKVSRASAKMQLPIKVKGKWFFFILDTRSGKFQNPELFDRTAGMKRLL